MRRSYKIVVAAFVTVTAAACCCAAYYWYGGTPRSGSSPQLPVIPPVSAEITVWDRPLTTITNAAGLNLIMEMLRSGRSVRAHACKDRGVMLFRFADGQSLRLHFLPGHNFFRYEYNTTEGSFAISRRHFLGALKAAGIDVSQIPTD